MHLYLKKRKNFCRKSGTFKKNFMNNLTLDNNIASEENILTCTCYRVEKLI